MLKLSTRLTNIASLVNRGDNVADIGTDHGLLPIYLVSNNISNKVIAMDINKGPLLSANKNIEENNLTDKIETRLSNGFEKLNIGEVDCAVIAGMGGSLVANIIRENINIAKSLKYLIVSPQSEIDKFRETMRDLGFKVIDEKIVFDSEKYYFIMKYQIGLEEELSLKEKHFGRILLKKKDKTLLEYLQNEKRIYLGILKQLENQMKKNNSDVYNDVYNRNEKRLVEVRGYLTLLDETIDELL
ncbi:MAG: class I SAM-dependent methyltransferase [Lachnospiraceae bacterium]|jgi:tRNA (adenine22-N1)-methyltransferase|nr:class I SAM-dependent methyltransferase [Lachnospiraceae bacterium]